MGVGKLQRRTIPRYFIILSKPTPYNYAFLLLFLVLVRFSFSRKKNVVIPINGRLGNQLFQLAASVSIKPHVRNLYWIENLYDEDTDYRAELFPPTLHSVHSEENLPCTPTKEYKVDYNCSNLLRQSDWPWYATCFKMIQPYFQCHELAARGLPLVVSSLLKQTYRLNTARQFMARNFWNEELIAIHVRRGDYLKSFNRRLLEPLSVSYYSAALSAHFRPNCSVLVFSDEIPWCKTVFTYSADLPFHFKFMDVRDPILALFIMASADHHIIANSTFSWWAAFLHDSLVALIRPLHKIRKHAVIAPNPWFGRRMMKKHIDLIPHHWIQFNVTSETTITSNKT